jgi:FKBP-type peptidyl-prolyl cis-trans isomerase 2
MRRAKPGDRVILHYIGTLDNGRIFASADADQPLAITLGADEVFPKLEAAVLGMREGEAKNLTLTAEEAYGSRRPENLLKLSRSDFPADREPKVGEKLSVDFATGGSRVVRVIEVTDMQVTLDGNHALAGCALTFAFKLVRIA